MRWKFGWKLYELFNIIIREYLSNVNLIELYLLHIYTLHNEYLLITLCALNLASETLRGFSTRHDDLQQMVGSVEFDSAGNVNFRVFR